MRKWMWRVVALLAFIGITVAATGCSKLDDTRWRKTFNLTEGEQYVVVVSVPLNNPRWNTQNGQNQTQWFVDAVEEAVGQWNAHPDMAIILVVEEGANRTCTNWFDNPETDWNCVEAWVVPNETFSGGVAASAGVWEHDGYRWNFGSDINEPSRINVSIDWSSQGAQADIQRRNAVCHELGHVWGLRHADPVDLDQDPQTGPDGKEYQPQGPCQNAVPDRDEDAPYDLAGFDWQNIDTHYDTCANDPHGPPGASPTDPNDDLDTIGYDECENLRSSGASEPEDVGHDPGDRTLEVHEETFDFFEDAA